MKKIAIVQDPENEVTQEILAQAIADVAEAAKKLTNGPLEARAIHLLIKDKCNVGIPDIRRVLEAAADLGSFLKKTKKP